MLVCVCVFGACFCVCVRACVRVCVYVCVFVCAEIISCGPLHTMGLQVQSL